jgi:hypothetical protein
LLHTGVLRLPLAAGVRLQQGDGDSGSSSIRDISPNAATAGYLGQLTELRWGVPEWEQRLLRVEGRWVAANGPLAPDGSGLPDLKPLLQASGLQVVQLAHMPASAEGQLELVRLQLPLLRHLQVNSATLVP